jgi:hypothetical protein
MEQLEFLGPATLLLETLGQLFEGNASLLCYGIETDVHVANYAKTLMFVSKEQEARRLVRNEPSDLNSKNPGLLRNLEWHTYDDDEYKTYSPYVLMIRKSDQTPNEIPLTADVLIIVIEGNVMIEVPNFQKFIINGFTVLAQNDICEKLLKLMSSTC